MKPRFIHKMLPVLIPFLCAAVVFLLMQTVFLFGYVPSSSMEPTLSARTYIIGLRIFNSLEKNDIIIFHHNDKVLIKRICAIPGEIVVRSDGSAAIVPDGCYYVLGDNRDVSVDSRYWKDPFVKESDIIATLLFP